MKYNSKQKTGVGITNKFEVRFIYLPNDRSKKYELLTFERYDGVVRSTAHAYEGEYKKRKYVGDIIRINSSNDTDFKSVERTHNKSIEMLKKYHLVKYNYSINK